MAKRLRKDIAERQREKKTQRGRDGWMKEWSGREKEVNKLLAGLDSSVETQGRV